MNKVIKKGAVKKKPNMALQNLARKVFSTSGRYSWPTDLRKAYFSELKNMKKITSKDLPVETYKEPVDDIINSIKKFDDNFQLFSEYHQRYERYGKKLIEIYKLEPFSNKETDFIMNKLNSKSYGFDTHSDWTPISIKKDEQRIKISLAKTAIQIMNTPLKESDLKENIWNAIEKSAINKLSSGQNLLEISARISAPKRTMINIEIDLEEDNIRISRDNFAVDQKGARIAGTDIETREKESALKEVANILELDDSKDSFTSVTSKDDKKIINKEVFDSFHKINQDNFLIIHKQQKYKRTDVETDLLSENVTSELWKQQAPKIKSKVAGFYDKNNSLTGFLEEFPGHNADNAKAISFMENNPEAVRTAYRSFAFIIRDCNLYENSSSKYKTHMKDKKVDWLQYDIDREEGTIQILNSNFSEEAHETIIQQILKYSKK